MIVYESRYGNTRAVGEAIAEVLASDGAYDIEVVRIGALRLSSLEEADLIVVGSPNHGGSSTRNIKRLLKRMGGLDLSGSRIALFDTCMHGGEGVASGKMVALAQKAGAAVVTPGLSTVVRGFKGPLAEGALDEAREFTRTVLVSACPSTR